MALGTTPKESILNTLAVKPSQETWGDVDGKTVKVQISLTQGARTLEFLGVAGQMSAGDIRGLAEIDSSGPNVSDDIVRLQTPTGNGLVDPDSFKARMQLWAEENGFAVQ